MNVTLSTIKRKFAIVFLEENIVFSKSPVQHIEQIHKVLSLLCDASVTLKLKNYRFITDAIDYLSHVIRPRRHEIATYTTNVIRRLQQRKSLTKPCSFLRLCILFQSYVPSIVRIAAAKQAALKRPTVDVWFRKRREDDRTTHVQNCLHFPIVTLRPLHRWIPDAWTQRLSRRDRLRLATKQYDDITKQIGYCFDPWRTWNANTTGHNANVLSSSRLYYYCHYTNNDSDLQFLLPFALKDP